VGRKTETERERERQQFFFKQKGEDERKETAGYFLEKRRVKRKGIKGSRNKKKTGENRGGKRKKKKRERVDRSSNGGGIETKTEKKETTATFKPRIATAATAPLSRCHRSSQPLPPSTKYSSNRHLQPSIPATATALPSHRHHNTTENGHQHHRQLSHPRSSPQVILFPPIAVGHHSSSC